MSLALELYKHEQVAEEQTGREQTRIISKRPALSLLFNNIYIFFNYLHLGLVMVYLIVKSRLNSSHLNALSDPICTLHQV